MLNRAALTALIRDTSLVTLACAIALGWALFQVAEGLATFVLTFTGEYERNRLAIYPDIAPAFSAPLLWEAGGRLIYLAPLVAGIIEFGLVLLVVLAIRRATSERTE